MTHAHRYQQPGDPHVHWTYTTGNYRSFLYWHSFEEACNAAFENSPDVMTAHVFSPSGPGLDVTREQWAATTVEEWEAARKP